MMAEENAYQIVERLYEELGYNPDAITTRLFTELGVKGHAKNALFSMVRDRVQHACRSLSLRTRSSRQNDFASQSTAASPRKGTPRPQARSRSTADSQRSTDPRLAFLDTQVSFEGEVSMWGDLTASQHQRRREMFLGQQRAAAASSVTETWALDILAKLKKDTLRAVPATKLVASLPPGGLSL